MMTKAEIFLMIKSGKKPQGFSRDTGRNAFLQSLKILDKGMDKAREVNSPGPSPRLGGGE